MPCSGCTAYLSVHMYSDAATHKPGGLWVMGDQSRFTAAYSFIPWGFFKNKPQLVSKGDPSSFSMLCREVVPQSTAQDARHAGWKQGSICSKSHKPTPWQGCLSGGWVHQLSCCPLSPPSGQHPCPLAQRSSALQCQTQVLKYHRPPKHKIWVYK